MTSRRAPQDILSETFLRMGAVDGEREEAFVSWIVRTERDHGGRVPPEVLDAYLHSGAFADLCLHLGEGILRALVALPPSARPPGMKGIGAASGNLIPFRRRGERK